MPIGVCSPGPRSARKRHGVKRASGTGMVPKSESENEENSKEKQTGRQERQQ